MKQSTTTYVAMDTHKKTISVALAEGGRRGETRFIGEIPSRPEAVGKMVDRLAKKHGQLAFWSQERNSEPGYGGGQDTLPRARAECHRRAGATRA